MTEEKALADPWEYNRETHLPRSPSQVTQYERCAWAYKLNKVDRVTRRPAWWSIGGSAVHLATEVWDRELHSLGDERARGAAVAALEESLEAAEAKGNETGLPWLIGGGRSPQGKDWWFEQGPEMLDRWRTYRSVYQGDMVEVEAEARGVMGGVPMRGFVDRVEIQPSGEPQVVDVKAGSRTPSDPFQLVVYADLFQKQYTVKRAAFWMARKGEIVPFDITDDMIQQARQRVQLMHNADRRGIYFPSPGENCKTCDVSHACAFNIYRKQLVTEGQ